VIKDKILYKQCLLQKSTEREVTEKMSKTNAFRNVLHIFFLT